MSCGQCDKELPEDGEYVTCRKCELSYHYECSGIKKTKSKNTKAKNEWECGKCRIAKTRNQSVDDDLASDDPIFQTLKKLLENMFKTQEKVITERVDRVMAVVSQLEEKFMGVLDKLRELETKTLSLQDDMEDLKQMLEMEKQYGRSKNFIVTSLPCSDQDDVGNKVISLLEAMKISIKREEITAHKLPSKNSPAPIIVQCMTREKRDYVVRQARKFRPKLSLISDSYTDRAIYFNDHLTPYFSNLMSKATQIKKSKGYKFIWLNGNKIMLKKDNMSKAIQIVKEKDLEKIV